MAPQATQKNIAPLLIHHLHGNLLVTPEGDTDNVRMRVVMNTPHDSAKSQGMKGKELRELMLPVVLCWEQENPAVLVASEWSSIGSRRTGQLSAF